MKKERKDTTFLTSKRLDALLPKFLCAIEERRHNRPDEVIGYWKELVGDNIASMARAVTFEKGVLFVAVQNSTLLSLLARQEKKRLLSEFKKKFTGILIADIAFRIG